VCGGEDDAGALLAALEQALHGTHTLVSDVSHSRVVFALEGEHAREVLLKGSSLDLDAAAFRVDQCAQSALARAHMLLHQVSDAPGYHVYAHRSFADYVFSWLCDAAQEYGLELAPS
jgi:sarcosine oxidase subunit gamma